MSEFSFTNLLIIKFWFLISLIMQTTTNYALLICVAEQVGIFIQFIMCVFWRIMTVYIHSRHTGSRHSILGESLRDCCFLTLPNHLISAQEQSQCKYTASWNVWGEWFLALNHHKNWVPTILIHNLWLIFMGMKQNLLLVSNWSQNFYKCLLFLICISIYILWLFGRSEVRIIRIWLVC